VGVGANSCTYQLDVAGDVNTSTEYRVGGTAGASATVNGLTFAGGIYTGGGGSGTPTVSVGSITGTNTSWRVTLGTGTITSFTVTFGGSTYPSNCVSLDSSSVGLYALPVSGSSYVVGSASNMASTSVSGVCQ
jgi:hypothetical protein